MSKKKIGTRYNSNKLRWRNFPLFLVKPLIEVAQQGEEKYGTYNFLKGQSVRNCMDSIMRHYESFEDPYQNDNDSESKCSHLLHVAWNSLVAAYMIKMRPDLDDRYKGEKNVSNRKRKNNRKRRR